MKTRTFCLWTLGIVTATQPLLINCNADELSGKSTAVDPYLACVRKLAFDAQFEELSKKLPLYDMTNITFAMLADNSRPTPQERKDLLAWFDKRDKCWKDGEPLHEQQWPPDIFQLSQEGNAELHNIGLDLYNGKATFGETNKRIQDYGNSIRARLIPIIKQYQAEIAAQKAVTEQQVLQRQEASNRQAAQEQANANAQYAQEQALRQQRAQLFMNYMGAMQQQQQQLRQQQMQMMAPRPTYTTNCSTSGNSTNCTTR